MTSAKRDARSPKPTLDTAGQGQGQRTQRVGGGSAAGGRGLTVLGEAGGLEPREGRVGKGADLVAGLEGAPPGGHDKDVVGGDDVDSVNALGLELVKVLEVRGQVVGRAGGRERAGHAEQDDCNNSTTV